MTKSSINIRTCTPSIANYHYFQRMVELKIIVGIVGDFISLLVFLSPIKTFSQIVKKRSTEDFDGLPYVCTFLQASLWFYYAITKTGAIVVAFICAVGSVLELIYVTLFLIYAPSQKKAKTALWVGLLDVGFLGVILLITHFAMHGDLRLNIVGSTCAVISIIMYGSPLANMRTVITTESVEYMPFLLSFVLFLNGAVWTFYAVLIQDLFIGVPNGIGLALGLTQLILYAIYMKPGGGKGGIEEMEEGKQPLIHS